MVTSTYEVLVDWDDDDIFTGTGEDITARCLRFEWSLGRDYGSQILGRSTAGKFSAIVDNESGDYSPFNTSSPLAGNLEPGRKIKVTMNSTVQWQGFVTDVHPMPNVSGANLARITGEGPLGRINRGDVELGMQTSIGTGALVTAVLDKIGWPAGDRTIATGDSTVARFWSSEKKALEVLREIEATEVGFIREGKDGKIIFEERQHRLKTDHLTSQVTFSDAPAATVGYRKIQQSNPVRGILNNVRARYIKPTVASIADLWTSPEGSSDSTSRQILDTQSVTFVANYPAPDDTDENVSVDAWTTPVASTDFTVHTAADGTGTDLSASVAVAVVKSSNKMEITLTNNSGSDGYVTLVKARGTKVTYSDIVEVIARDTTSESAVGKRNHMIPTRFFADSEDAQWAANWILSITKDRAPTILISVNANKDTTHRDAVEDHDISDRVTLTADNASGLGVDEDCFIENMKHVVTQGKIHWCTFTLSPASILGGFFIMNTSLLGTSTRLAY